MSTRCYGIDGTPYATFDRYIPCNATAAALGKQTACCAPGDNCLTNGLCQGQTDNKAKRNLFWRNGCTDPTWNDPACAKHCEGLDKPDTHAIHYCLSSNSWCCPTGPLDPFAIVNTTCCNKADLTFSAADPIVYTIANIGDVVSTVKPSGNAQSTAVAATSTFQASSIAVTAFATASSSVGFASSSPQASELAGGGNNARDGRIGIYVGVPLGILLAIALGVIAWLAFKLKKKNAAQYAYAGQGGLPETEGFAGTPVSGAGSHMKEAGMSGNGMPPRYVHASEVETMPAEVPNGDYMRAELGTGK